MSTNRGSLAVVALLIAASSGCDGDDAATDTTAVPATIDPTTTSIATTVSTAPPTTLPPTTLPPTTLPQTTTALQTTIPPTTAPPTTLPPTTAPPTTAPPTTAPPTLPPTTTTEPCTPPAGTTPVNTGFPSTMSALVGSDIRTGGHPCFERVVLEMEGTGTQLPGYLVEYVDDPVLLSPIGTPVEIQGDATLLLSIGIWMYTFWDNAGYTGPDQIFPSNVVHIRELRMIENYEGQSAWAIGVDQQRPFEVFSLADPPRIVIDIAAP